LAQEQIVASKVFSILFLESVVPGLNSSLEGVVLFLVFVGKWDSDDGFRLEGSNKKAEIVSRMC
jgi:hypothetical protein